MRKNISNLLPLIIVWFVFVSGCAEKKMSISDALDWYNENENQLYQLHLVLMKSPSIARVDPGLRLKFVDKYADFDAPALQNYERAVKACKEMGIKNIAIYRSGNIESGGIISVSYTIYASGISISSGGFICIQFIPDTSFVEELSKINYQVISLPKEGWYLVSGS